MNKRGLFLPLAQLNIESVSLIILCQFWKKCMCHSRQSCLPACTFCTVAELPQKLGVVCPGKYKERTFVAFL